MPLSQRVDINGVPLSGALLYLYQANTTIPVNSYQDFGLTLLNPNPLICDASGMIPEFWLADGSYRARLTDASGTLIFDRLNVTALGPSITTGGGGGGGGGSVDPNAIAQTGDFIWLPVKGIVRAGWVMSDGRQIGSVSSGATQRANADTQALFIYLWNNFSNTLCPVGGGRSGSAIGDFNANKPIGTLDMRSEGIFGLDDMGNVARGRITSGTPTAAASELGSDKTTITQANIPNYNLSASGLTGAMVDPTIVNGTQVARNPNTATNNQVGGGGNVVLSVSQVTLSIANPAITVSGTISSGGSGTAMTTISPGRFGTFYVKL